MINEIATNLQQPKLLGEEDYALGLSYARANMSLLNLKFCNNISTNKNAFLHYYLYICLKSIAALIILLPVFFHHNY